MNMRRTQTDGGSGLPRTSRRAGLSLLEFVGCLIAVVGGAWLGAIYLGVDVQHLAHTALAEANLLDAVPEEWRPESPQDDNGDLSREQLVASLRDELVALRHEITALRSTGNAPLPEAHGDAPVANTVVPTTGPLPSKEKTLAYWNRLSEIALGEAALQRDAESASTDANASKVYAIKSRVGRFAAKAVDAIPDDRVDKSVLQLGRQLADWYDRGAELCENAIRLREFPENNASRERLTEEWRRSQVQHRNEAKMLSNKAILVQDEMRRVFGEEFPAFGQPSGAAAPSQPSKKQEG